MSGGHDSHGGGGFGNTGTAIAIALVVIALAMLFEKGPFNPNSAPYQAQRTTFVPTARYEHYGGPPAINANVDHVRPGFRVEHY